MSFIHAFLDRYLAYTYLLSCLYIVSKEYKLYMNFGYSLDKDINPYQLPHRMNNPKLYGLLRSMYSLKPILTCYCCIRLSFPFYHLWSVKFHKYNLATKRLKLSLESKTNTFITRTIKMNQQLYSAKQYPSFLFPTKIYTL